MANRRTELFNPDVSQWRPGPHFTSSTSFRFSPCIARVVSLSCALCLQGCYGTLDNTIKDVHGPEHGATVARIAQLAQENTKRLIHPYSPIREPSLDANDTPVGGTEKEHTETNMVAHAQNRPNPEWDYAKGPPQYCLALSGGGIRAAAYARGVLQGLSEADDPHGWSLENLDIVSAVSGGSYAASWYMARLGGRMLDASGTRNSFNEEQFIPGFELHGFAELFKVLFGTLLKMPFYLLELGDSDDATYMTKYYAERIRKHFYAPYTPPAITAMKWQKPLLIVSATIDGRNREETPPQNSIFEFTPYHVGAQGIGFRPTSEFSDDWITLENIITISGAALDTTASSFWTSVRPLFGFTTGRKFRNQLRHPPDKFWLTDGGYSENLGAYPLIKRRCENIIIVDAEHDPAFTFTAYNNLRSMLWLHNSIQLAVDTIDLTDGVKRPDRAVWTLPVMQGQIKSIPMMRNNSVYDPPVSVTYLKLSMDPCQTTDEKETLPFKTVGDCLRGNGNYAYGDSLRKTALRRWWDDYPDRRLGPLGLILGPLFIPEDWRSFPQIPTYRQDLPDDIVRALIALGRCHIVHALRHGANKPVMHCDMSN